MRCIDLCVIIALSVGCPLIADTTILGDISYQPGDPITGLTDIILDNFTDALDLGCSTTYAACGGIDISGTLDVTYVDSGGNTQNADISVGPTAPGSTAIYEFDPSQITFESAVLTGTISPTTFPLADGNMFVSDGTYISDTLTADVGFATIAVTGTEVSPVTALPEPVDAGFPEMAVLTSCLFLCWRRFRLTAKR
jgi:hypothetical protein